MKPTESSRMSRIIARTLQIGYPTLILAICCWMTVQFSHAGTIRKLPISSDRPGAVTLAMGHTTALSFAVKPDRVVVGAPEKLHVDFLGNDVIVSPIGREPGNLLIYTKAGRYVILFRLGTPAQYDDVVEITEGAGSTRSRPLRLLEDSYTVETVSVRERAPGSKQKETQSELPVWISRDGKTLSGEELSQRMKNLHRFHCDGCLTRVQPTGEIALVCSKPVGKIQCQSQEKPSIQIERRASGATP